MPDSTLTQETIKGKAVELILEYWQIRRQMIDLTKRIKNEYINDTDQEEHGFNSNHVHDYFEADKECRKEYGERMEFNQLGKQVDIYLMSAPKAGQPHESATLAHDIGCISCQERELAIPAK